jgi:hypothetical protein
MPATLMSATNSAQAHLKQVVGPMCRYVDHVARLEAWSATSPQQSTLAVAGLERIRVHNKGLLGGARRTTPGATRPVPVHPARLDRNGIEICPYRCIPVRVIGGASSRRRSCCYGRGGAVPVLWKREQAHPRRTDRLRTAACRSVSIGAQRGVPPSASRRAAL